jgi:adenine/guanine/hypoxanthine permease
MVLGFLPSVAYLLSIKLGNPAWIAPEKFAALASALDGHGLPDLAVIRTLGNGFIITSMLWIATVAALVDGRLRRAAGLLLVAAAFAAFGVIHSADARGGLHWPWQLDGLAQTISLQFVAAYVVLGAVLAALSLVAPVRPQPDDA